MFEIQSHRFMDPMGIRLGKHLREVRLASGKTQAEVAKELGVSRATVAQIELGNRALKVEEAEKVARAYGTDPKRLLASSARAARSDEILDELIRRVPSMGDLAGETERLLRTCRTLTEMEELLSVNAYAAPPPIRGLPMPGSAWEAVHQGYESASEERRRLDLGEGPIRDVDETLMLNGVRATKLPLPEGITSLILSSPETGHVVVANAGIPYEERRFHYVHAYAHLLFDRAEGPHACQGKNCESLPEIRANAFASRFLVPEQGIKRYLRSLGKDTLARTGKAKLEIYSERETDSFADRSVSVSGRDRHGVEPCGVVEVQLIARFFGVSGLLICHVLHDIGFLSRSRLADLAERVAGDRSRRIRAALDQAAGVQPGTTDVFRTRLVALAGQARLAGLISKGRMKEILDLIPDAVPFSREVAADDETPRRG